MTPITAATLQIEVSAGEGELRAGTDHPLAGPFRVGLLHGRPPGTWGFLAVAVQPHPKVLGAFVDTPGNRLLFFPGASTYLNGSQFGLGNKEFLLDHITIEGPHTRGRYGSHVALRAIGGRQHRTGGWSTRVRAGWLVPWFTMLAPGLDDFQPLPKRLLINFTTRRPDLQRFADEMIGGGTVALAPMPALAEAPNFLQVDVWVGRWVGWEASRAEVLPWAYKGGVVVGAPEGGQEVDTVAATAHLAADLGISAIVSMPTGTVDHPRFLRLRVPVTRRAGRIQANP